MPDNPRISKRQGFWTGGMDSLLNPSDLGEGKYAYGLNTTNRGGIVQTRPGFKLVNTISGTRVQGFTIFTQKQSLPAAVVAVDGLIYFAAYPFTNFVKIKDIAFEPMARQINFQQCTKSVKRNIDGTLTTVSPYQVLVMQDGTTRAAFWDGSHGRHLDPSPPALEAPVGMWMSWTASRLWVARGTRVFVSDIADPLSFSEDKYLAERSAFEMPDTVTGMVQTADQRGLLVFTESTTTSFRADIRDRTLWQTTTDFQRLLLPSIGCIAGKSPRNQYGLTHWFSNNGLTTLDAALYAQRTAQILSIDGEMMRSKRNMSPDTSGICTMEFDNFFLASVPSGDLFNSHTWVMDRAPSGEGGQTAAWSSIWTGVRPIEWSTATVGGRAQCYFVSYGESARDGNRIHLWEAFIPSRKDNDGSIICQMETAGVRNDKQIKFNYAEIEIVELLGDVNLTAYVRGVRGPWFKILDADLQAEEGSIGSSQQLIITEDSILQAFKPQSRSIRTKEMTAQGNDCLVESKDTPGVDKAFFLLLEWRGRMGVREVNLFMQVPANADRGRCAGDESGEHNVITESGEAA